MIVKNILKLFNKPDADKNKSSFPSLLEQIVTSMDLLNQKAGTMNDSWAEEKNQIKNLSELVAHMESSDDILATKFEQDILGKITALSSSCDSAIAGKKDCDVKKALASLSSSISQRQAVKDRQEA